MRQRSAFPLGTLWNRENESLVKTTRSVWQTHLGECIGDLTVISVLLSSQGSSGATVAADNERHLLGDREGIPWATRHNLHHDCIELNDVITMTSMKRKTAWVHCDDNLRYPEFSSRDQRAFITSVFLPTLSVPHFRHVTSEATGAALVRCVTRNTRVQEAVELSCFLGNAPRSLQDMRCEPCASTIWGTYEVWMNIVVITNVPSERGWNAIVCPIST